MVASHSGPSYPKPSDPSPGHWAVNRRPEGLPPSFPSEEAEDEEEDTLQALLATLRADAPASSSAAAASSAPSPPSPAHRRLLLRLLGGHAFLDHVESNAALPVPWRLITPFGRSPVFLTNAQNRLNRFGFVFMLFVFFPSRRLHRWAWSPS